MSQDEFCSIAEAARLFGYETINLIRPGALGKLPIYAWLTGLRLRKYEPTNFPDDDDRFPNALINYFPVQLWPQNLAEIGHRGTSICRVVDKVDPASGARCTYEIFIDKDGVLQPGFVEITAADLIIFPSDLEKFEAQRQTDAKQTARPISDPREASNDAEQTEEGALALKLKLWELADKKAVEIRTHQKSNTPVFQNKVCKELIKEDATRKASEKLLLGPKGSHGISWLKGYLKGWKDPLIRK